MAALCANLRAALKAASEDTEAGQCDTVRRSAPHRAIIGTSTLREG